MLEYDKISHDLAIIKLQGSELPMDKLVDEYRKYYQEAYDRLKATTERRKTAIQPNPQNR